MSTGDFSVNLPESDIMEIDDLSRSREEIRNLGEFRESIIDTGGGMSRSVMRRIFDPFFTTKIEGTGPGLSMAYNIIKAHNGFINVYSEPGEGSTFNIYLPVISHGLIDYTNNEETEIKRGTGLVLIVDDEVINA